MRGRSGPVLLLCAREKRSVRMREPQRATANSTISKANEVNYTSLATNKSDITSYTSTSHINNKICNVFIYFYIPYNFCLINVAAALKIAERKTSDTSIECAFDKLSFQQGSQSANIHPDYLTVIHFGFYVRTIFYLWNFMCFHVENYGKLAIELCTFRAIAHAYVNNNSVSFEFVFSAWRQLRFHLIMFIRLFLISIECIGRVMYAHRHGQ